MTGNGTRSNPGVQVTATSKEEWTRISLGVLEQHALRIARDLVCVGDSEAHALLGLLLSELTMLRCFPKEGAVSGAPMISGKADSSGRITSSMLADDTAIGFVIGLSVVVKLKQNSSAYLYGTFTHSQVSELSSKQAWDFRKAQVAL